MNDDEIAQVRENIPADFPEADVRLRLALGAEIPNDVELHEFPVAVLDRIPRLGDFRFVVSGDQIVFIRPRDRSIALMIDKP